MTTTRTFTRRCPECGDTRKLRQDGRQPADSLVVRSCRPCVARKVGPLSRLVPAATPRDDIDDVMVDRIMGGRASGANIAERLEATARLVGLYRLSTSLVAERLGVTRRTVERYKAELRETGRLAA